MNSAAYVERVWRYPRPQYGVPMFRVTDHPKARSGRRRRSPQRARDSATYGPSDHPGDKTDE